MSWIEDSGPMNEVVLSSRVRLARNISKIPFPSALTGDSALKVADDINKVYSAKYPQYDFYDMKATKAIQKQVLLERHLISQDLLKKGEGSAAIISEADTISIMINEEDHIRIQSIYPGMQIRQAWDTASCIDDALEEKLEYAFDEKWGYLTSCPTNVGTGLRASFMVHLPALNLTGNMGRILQAVVQLGLTIRGLYGEGSDIVGNMFQISNQITLGRSEEEIIENLTAVTNQIIQKEKEARVGLLKNSKIQIEDKIWRSWGIMKNARMMQSNEALKLLSDIRLGVDMNILPNIPVAALNEIMIETQPASIQIKYENELASPAREIIRAEIIRNKLGNISL